VLLVQRSDGRWRLPGGRVEAGETFAEAAVRAVADETGVVVRFTGVACVTETTRRDRHVVFVTCLTQMLGGEVRVPEDDAQITGVRWVDHAEAAELLPSYPSRDVILRRDPPHVPHFVDAEAEI
jgi:ADP-ribose pyrophosphatase YjhB (NUDIX family)